ncbi:hypothetical protein GALMADRAFT_764828 [Galerina marginata CBS 339.88]|uniref:Uncharacterized protein n=1 Tax=Galerina marginata (strain CBS 339.88) TaxID=685588 RepID=A0A067SRS9_GALM3|nr:hypothetical protein GALMADRAFT_764828 [Galerina marginata CBS 339.88]
MQSRKRTRHSCSTENCYNLLTPGVRWRTCEECRNADRIRKMEVRAEVKAVENVLWKELAQQMSAARRAGEEGAGTGVPDGGAPVASGSGSGAANAPEVSPSTSMDIYADADADGDSEHGDDENREKERAPVAVAVVDTYPTQLPTWRTKKAPSTSTEPIFNSLTKEDYEKPAKPPLQASGFSKFRVELPPSAPGAPTSSLLMSDPLAFKGFKPTTTTAAIGRILASNPGISVDVFTNLLDAQKSKVSTTTSSPASGPQLRATAPVAKPVPTPTIPTSEPFVYKAPVKKAPPVPVPAPAPASEENATTPSASASTSNKGKRKATTQKEPETSTSTAPARTTPASASAPPPTSYGPYGYPPSYPYYPYYMPPYPMSPYAYPPPTSIPPESAKKGSSSSPAASSSSTPAAPSYYPYPYPPQPYGFPPPPPTGYPYLPPRYTTAAYGQATSQQPYPGQPPYSGQQAYPGFAAPTSGYPYYLPPPASSVSAPIAIATPAVLPNGTGVKPVKPPSGKNPSSEFSYYRPKVTEEEGADKPRKRRKVDTDFLEKYKAQTQAISLSLAKDAEKLATTSAVPPLPPALSTPVVTSAPAVASTAPSSAPPTSSKEETTEPIQPQASESAQPSGRPCATKTCHRKIPVAVGGTICEKCKLRFKKHQAKTKQKFKLEPRKFVLGKEANGKMEDSQDGVDGEPVVS